MSNIYCIEFKIQYKIKHINVSRWFKEKCAINKLRKQSKAKISRFIFQKNWLLRGKYKAKA